MFSRIVFVLLCKIICRHVCFFTVNKEYDDHERKLYLCQYLTFIHSLITVDKITLHNNVERYITDIIIIIKYYAVKSKSIRLIYTSMYEIINFVNETIRMRKLHSVMRIRSSEKKPNKFQKSQYSFIYNESC